MVAVVLLVAWILTIVVASPDTWWVESIMVVEGGGAILFGVAALTGKRKWGVLVAAGCVGLALLNRLDILSFLTVGLLMIAIGLISWVT